MLDRRALILALSIVVAAAGAYAIWIKRPHATIQARSLSASGHPANTPTQPITSSLHVEGCKDNFIVTPGEIIEPLVVPDASVDLFRSVYGSETRRPQPDSFYWHTEAFEMLLANPDHPTATEPSSLQISLNSGHIVKTLDGIELGLDSFGTILRKMRDRKVEVHERIRHTGDQGSGHWILTLTLYSSCGRNFRSEYVRSIPDDPETTHLINRRITGGNGQTGLIRSDIFMNKVVYDYALEPSNGSDDDPSAGEPSEHD